MINQKKLLNQTLFHKTVLRYLTKQGVLKVTEELSKFQPQYVQMISNLQQEYIQLTKEFVNKVFAAQRNWAGSNVTSTSTTIPTSTYAPYVEQFRIKSNEITAQALSVPRKV